MNPWDLSASELLIWGLVLHLIADWLLQNDWMASNKMKRGNGKTDNPAWWNRHWAAYVHASIHAFFLALIFGWVAIPLAFAHLIIDCRWVVVKWAQLIRQTPANLLMLGAPKMALLDVGAIVRIWVDQVFHITCIAVAALLVTL